MVHALRFAWTISISAMLSHWLSGTSGSTFSPYVSGVRVPSGLKTWVQTGNFGHPAGTNEKEKDNAEAQS